MELWGRSTLDEGLNTGCNTAKNGFDAACIRAQQYHTPSNSQIVNYFPIFPPNLVAFNPDIHYRLRTRTLSSLAVFVLFFFASVRCVDAGVMLREMPTAGAIGEWKAID
jgi:hypothetical protein